MKTRRGWIALLAMAVAVGPILLAPATGAAIGVVELGVWIAAVVGLVIVFVVWKRPAGPQ